MNIIKSALLAAIFFASAPAFAFDDSRQGLILGFGAGYDAIKLDTVNSSGNTGTTPENGLTTSLKMGMGITEKIALYYVQTDSWFRMYPTSASPEQSMFTLGMSGIGATYFLSPTAPSYYFTAATGVGYLRAPFDKGVKSKNGNAFMFGAGYEYEPNLTVEATFLAARYDSGLTPGVTLKSSSLQIMLSYLLY